MAAKSKLKYVAFSSSYSSTIINNDLHFLSSFLDFNVIKLFELLNCGFDLRIPFIGTVERLLFDSSSRL